MDELDKIFIRLDKKKMLIDNYIQKFETLNKNKNNYSEKDFIKTQNAIYKDFKKELKIIEKS